MVRLSKRKALVPKTTARRIVRPGGEQLTASLSIRRSGGPVAGTFSGGGVQTILRKRVRNCEPRHRLQQSGYRGGFRAGIGIEAMAADTKPLTLEDLRRELDRTLQHYATKADLHALETRLTVRLVVALAALGGVLVAVDRLWI